MNRPEQHRRKANQACPASGEKLPCEHCGAETRADVVKAAFWAGRGWMAIEDIPARVCEVCGEQFFDEATARKIEKLIVTPPAQAKRRVLLPVFSIAQVEDD
jgi:YgiT-type zinc finger domain-containing protein